MLYATLVLTLLAGSLTWWVLNRQLKPMQTAAKALAELSDSSQPLQPLPITTQDEISDLVGGFNRVLGILSQREQAVKDSELRWKFALEGAGDGIYDWNVQTNQEQYSKRWKEMLGYTDDDILPLHQEWVEHIHPEDRDRVTGALTAYLSGESETYTVDYRLRCKDGSYKWILSRGIIVDHSDDGKPLRMIGTHTDITEQKEHENQLEYMAHYDLLTGLPNRALLADRLHQAMAQANRRGQLLAVAYLDLDGFKMVNDRYGHETGDQLLIALSNRMKQTMREGDTLARLGGDEFVAVLFDLANTGGPMLNRLLEAAAQPVGIGEHVFKVSASLGVTFYPQADAVDADHLLRQADQAMYQAKLAGKNCYHFFDTEQDRSVRGRHESLEHIRNALAAQEFVLHYQPKVNMRTGLVIGAEALIRWQHPERGLLPPGIFLPVIEDHPLAIEIGEWVIDTALTQMERWRAVGLDLPVSVNVGALQLLQADFVDRLREILANHPTLSPDTLEIEILETSALEDLDQVSQVIEDSQAIGVNFALDDFGTGYSSLTYLKRLSVNQLKIDQSFVRDMLDDPDDLSILGGVLGLATAFRRQVIAEGVETVAHGSMLLQLGCELAQGYGIGRPMPADDLPAWVTTWRPDSVWSNLPPVNRDKLPLLFAAVEHRAWIQAVEDFIDGKREALPLMHHQCHFGTWLEREDVAHEEQTTFRETAELHHQLHQLAADLCTQKSHGQDAESHARLSKLQKLQNDFSGYLDVLMRGQNSF